METPASFCQYAQFMIPLVATLCDEEYPRYVAFTALKEALDTYVRITGERWQEATSDVNQSLTGTAFARKYYLNFSNQSTHLIRQSVEVSSCPFSSPQRNVSIELDQILQHFQNPEEADKVMKIHKELEETKQIVIKNLDQLLERGVKLDDLVAKSNDLSFQSKAFASRAEELNRCCTLL